MIDTFPDNWINDLKTKVFTTAEKNHNYFLLLDLAFNPDIYPLLQKNITECIYLYSLPNKQPDLEDVSPCLITLNQTSWAKLEPILPQCQALPMMSLIQTSEKIEQLATRLSFWNIVTVDQDTFALRYADTRILPVLYQAMTPAQKVSFTGNANKWRYINRKGVWSELTINQSTNKVLKAKAELSLAQYTQILDMNEADFLLGYLADYYPERLTNKHSEQHQQALKHLLESQRLGINDMEEHAQWLFIHQDYPKWQNLPQKRSKDWLANLKTKQITIKELYTAIAADHADIQDGRL